MKILFVFVLLFFVFGEGEGERRVTGAFGMEEILKEIPSFPIYDVRSFGAVGDAQTNNTDSIQKAIDTASGDGGGIVLFSNGQYLSGALEVKSKVFLKVDFDAVLLASHLPQDYPANSVLCSLIFSDQKTQTSCVCFVTGSNKRGFDGDCPWAEVTKSGVNMPVFLYAFEAKKIGIIGNGRIDGQAIPYFVGGMNRSQDKFIPITWQGDQYYGCQGECRPRLVQFTSSENIIVKDVTLANSPDWTSHYLNCTNILIEGVTIYGDYQWPNNDGIDPDSSSNITIAHTTISTGDDSICPKASSGFGPLKNMYVFDCELRSRSSGIKFGSATYDDMFDVLFERIWISETNRGLAIQHRDNGSIWNIEFHDIIIDGVSYQPTTWWGAAEPIWITSIQQNSDTQIGTVSNIKYKNVTARSENGVLFSSRTTTPLRNISLESVDISIESWHPKEKRRIDYSSSEHDYRPTNLVGNGGVIATKTDGFYFENVDQVVVVDSSVAFVGEESWWGVCVGYNNSYSNVVQFSMFHCSEIF